MTQRTSIIFFLFLLCIVIHVAADEHQYDEAVSLGYSCQVSWNLENNSRRTFAYPFDWFRTPFDSLTAFIKNAGAEFFDFDKLNVIGPYPGDIPYFHVIDLVYGIESFHDFFVTPPLWNYQYIKDKYDRRIKRFFSLLNSQKRVLFVRQDCTREQAEFLDQLLHDLYPNLSYNLLVVADDDEFLNDWGLERIKNYYIKNVVDWHGDVERWQEVLNNFSVTPPSLPRPQEEVW